MPAPAFKLFKPTSRANHCEYTGTVVMPDGRVYCIEANVVEHDRGDGSGTKGKHFEGRIFGGQELVKKMLKGAKIDGVLPDDLLKILEEVPFDDSAELAKVTG